MSDRRGKILAAGVEVLARKGVRGLTHRAVDEVAKLPQGSTSNHFRSRNALISALAEHLAQKELAAWEGVSTHTAKDPQALAQSLAAHVARVAESDLADLTRARLLLMLEHPTLIAEAHERVIAGLAEGVAAVGLDDARQRAIDVADYLDGLLLHLLTVRQGQGVNPAHLTQRLLTLMDA